MLVLNTVVPSRSEYIMSPVIAPVAVKLPVLAITYLSSPAVFLLLLVTLWYSRIAIAPSVPTKALKFLFL